MIALRSILFTLLSLCAVLQASAQTTIELKPIDAADYPKLHVSVKVTSNGASHTLQIPELTIIESNRSTQAFQISPIDAQGWQKVSWYTRSEGANQTTFIASVNNSTASANGSHGLADICQIRFCDPFGEPIKEFNFGALLPGQSDYTTFLARAVVSKKNSRGVEQSTILDSITFSSPDFSYRWIGSYISTQKPPVGLAPAVGYYFDVIFKPSRSGYYKEYAVLHYEGGQKEYVFLRANGFALEERQSLKLIQPNDATILTPCEYTTIKWKGYQVGTPVYVDWSKDNGKTWDTIGISMDSILQWKTPGTITDSGRIRIRQELSRSEEKLLLNPNLKGGASKIAWNTSSSQILAGYDNGKIAIWDKVNATIVDTFVLANINYPIAKVRWIGLGFINDSTIYAVYRLSSNSEEFLIVLRKGNPNPLFEKNITVQGTIKQVLTGAENTSVIAVPLRGNVLTRYALSDGSEMPGIAFPKPIAAFTSGNGTIGSIALVDGSINILDMKSFSIVKSMTNPALPLMNQLSISDDGTLLGAGTMLSEQSMYSASTSEVHVIDISTGLIVRSLRRSSSNVVGLSFSANNQFLATGFAGIPQIAVWKIPTNTFLGSISGHNGFLTDIQYSPNGKSIASSAESNDNVKIIDFAYPEKDTSDAFISIVASQPTIVKASLQPVVLMHQVDTVLKVNLCNGGRGNILIDYAYFRDGQHFTLAMPIPDTTSIKPGECVDIHLRVKTRDIGLLRDSLFFGFCSQEFYLPIEVESAPRNIAILANKTFLGSLCINESIEKTIDVLRNDDIVPLKINQLITNKPSVKILSIVKDTILQPGQTLSVKLQYTPKTLGEELVDISVYHSDLDKFVVYATVKGEGVGADVNVPSVIAFIPEQTTRTVTISNSSANEVQLIDAAIPSLNAKVLNALPITIPARKSITLTIEVLGQIPDSGISVACSFAPCATAKTIVLKNYSALATLSVPIIEADPREKTSIPISLSLQENIPYNASTQSYIEFETHARLFLPDSVESQYGTASISTHTIVGDLRIIGVTFEGQLPKNGIVCTVKGFAGIAEVQSSPIHLTSNSVIASTNVKTSFVQGQLKLINICKDLVLIQDTTLLQIQSVYPNPANESIALVISSHIDDEIQYRIIDNLGLIVKNSTLGKLNAETMQVVDLPSAIHSGSYSLQVFSEKHGILAQTLIQVIK